MELRLMELIGMVCLAGAATMAGAATLPADEPTELYAKGDLRMVTAGGELEESDYSFNVGLSDAWYDPQTPGQGFFITVLPELESIFLAWFTFDIERPPASITSGLGDPGHRWLTAFGDYSGTSAELQVELTSGGVFGAVQPDVTQTSSYGTITLEFTGCNELELAYELPSVARAGVINLQRISDDKVALCEVLSRQTELE